MIIKDTESADIDTPTRPMRTYLIRPAAEGRYPGLVLYSEIFQVTGPIRRAAAMLASHGFVVAVPEIYHELEPAGTVLAYDEAGAERGNRHKTIKALSSYDGDARAALDFLKSSPHCTGKLGVMGVCIGGHLAFRAAMQPDVLATTCFYATKVPATIRLRPGSVTTWRWSCSRENWEKAIGARLPLPPRPHSNPAAVLRSSEA